MINLNEKRELEEKPSLPVKRPYTRVFLSLAVLTILELNVGFIGDIMQNIPTFENIVELLVPITLISLAFTKAALVAAFFMGIKYQKRPWVTAGIMFGIPLFIALPVVLIPAMGTVVYLCGI